jgi:hypothetical protein
VNRPTRGAERVEHSSAVVGLLLLPSEGLEPRVTLGLFLGERFDDSLRNVDVNARPQVLVGALITRVAGGVQVATGHAGAGDSCRIVALRAILL